MLIPSHDDRSLRTMFLDLNAYFASVEQQERPELRGKPIAVVPVEAETTFIIAASYEAKKFGVKTGMRVDKSRELCPEIQTVQARHNGYVHYHNRVLEVVESVLPVEKVCSIDEMQFRLIGKEKEPEEARKIAIRMKQALCVQVGECIRCSIGVAPNPFLAKLATDLQKPDGYVVIQGHELPDRLRGLDVTEFTGINYRMKARLQAAGIFTSDDMIDCTPEQLKSAFGSIMGERWYYLLRGYDIRQKVNEQKSLGHSHILPPAYRTDAGAKEVMLRIAHKAAARLRANNIWAGAMNVYVGSFRKQWKAHTRLPPTQDPFTVTQHLLRLWEKRSFEAPHQVGIVFTDLEPIENVTPSLFDPTLARSELGAAVDRINQKFGKNTVYLAGMIHAKDTADERIAFGKTALFREGKGDHDWVDTFRGPNGGKLPDLQSDPENSNQKADNQTESQQ